MPKPIKAAVILVHGIGNMSPGGILAPAVDQAMTQLNSAMVTSKQKHDSSSSRIHIYHQDIHWQDYSATMTEFHWSGSAGKIQKWNVFSSLAMVFTMFWNLPRLGAWASTSKTQHVFANIMGALLVLSALVVTFSCVWFLAAEMEILDKVTPSTANILEPLFYVVCFGTLPLAGVSMNFLWFVHGKITRWGAQWIGVFAGNLLIVVYGMIFAVIVACAFSLYTEMYCAPTELTCGDDEVTHFEMGLGALIVLWLLYKFVGFAAGAADFCRDVVHYLAVEKDGRDHRDTRLIKSELHALMDYFINNGYERLVIVSHSLGTAISAEVLLERIERSDQSHVAIDFVTSGSPLRRMLHRLLPYRVPDPREIFQTLKNQQSFQFGRWLNLYRVLDPVGTKILSPKHGKEEDTETIQDQLLEPKWQWPWGHSNYWGDPRFLEALITNFIEHAPEEKTE